ncbi:MAG: aspartate aminotransferase [Hyphomicrobiales bacterium]|mgnify:FL=1|nr:MAG: aspartate aminotransferase [Hyphomicrobiales bacterium]
MTASRFHNLPESPFVRLRALLSEDPPGADIIDMTIGEPRHPQPGFIADAIAREAEGFGRYPPINGTSELRAAIAAWANRRYDLGEALDPDRHIAPLSGTREGLFYAAAFLLPDKYNPVMLLPNPYYPVYAAAAMNAGAEPVYLNCGPGTGFLPDLAALTPELLARTAGFYMCSPSNPQGAVAPPEYLAELLRLARRHDFVLIMDECYGEIYTGAPPPGSLAVAAKSGGFKNLLAFHSLSKRSNLPGLRSGFCAGDEDLVARFLRLRNVAGPQTPLPLQTAAAAAWSDEDHVEQNRRLYRAKFDAADEILGSRFGYRRPGGGFFIWLDMRAHGGGEAAALELWRGAGLRTIPGAYLGADTPGGNPGADFLRIALVQNEELTREGLTRLVGVLEE